MWWSVTECKSDIWFSLKHLEETPDAVCSVLNLHELVAGIFNDLFVPFEYKYKGNSISTEQQFTWTMAAEMLCFSQHYFTIYVSNIFNLALVGLSLLGSCPKILSIHSGQPKRFPDRKNMISPVSVSTLLRGKDEETRQKVAENTDAHVPSARNRTRISFFLSWITGFLLLLWTFNQCWRL